MNIGNTYKKMGKRNQERFLTVLRYNKTLSINFLWFA